MPKKLTLRNAMNEVEISRTHRLGMNKLISANVMVVKPSPSASMVIV